MHNRKKGAPPSAEQLALSEKKAAALKKLSTVALKQRADGPGSASTDAFKLNSELLSLNPDIATLWNYRREVLLARCEAEKDKGDLGSDEGAGAAISSLVAEELRVAAAGIARNPKSYPAWHHRQWMVAHFPAAIDFLQELALCGKLLEADERNFHCWNYRRWCVAVAATRLAPDHLASGSGGVSLVTEPLKAGSAMCSLPSSSPFSTESELAYTLQKINKNFSNYSAWHYRSHLLLLAEESQRKDPAQASSAHGRCPGLRPPQSLPLEAVSAELELVRKALYCEPDDQSGWFYHRWAVDRLRDYALCASGDDSQAARLLEVCLRDASALLELQEAEPSSKWPFLGVAHVLQALQSIVKSGASGKGGMCSSVANELGKRLDELSADAPKPEERAVALLRKYSKAGVEALSDAIEKSFACARDLDCAHSEAYMRERLKI